MIGHEFIYEKMVGQSFARILRFCKFKRLARVTGNAIVVKSNNIKLKGEKCKSFVRSYYHMHGKKIFVKMF